MLMVQNFGNRVCAMNLRTGLALLTLCALGTPARAEDARSSGLPLFAATPGLTTNGDSFWKGLYAGTEVFALSRKGAKGQAGGGAYIGYDRLFSNNLVLGVRASAGYSPALFQRNSFSGYDYATASVKAGYNMGRLTPYVTAGAVLAKPTTFGFGTTGESINGVFGGGGTTKTFATVGAGFDYAVTNKLTVGVGVSVSNNRGLLSPMGAGFH